MLKEILYDWGGANVWLFHAVNDVRGQGVDLFMLLGTGLADHGNYPLYLAMVALIGLLSVAGNGRGSWLELREQSLAWLTLLAVFSISYVADGWLLGVLKPLLDFPRPPAILPPGTVHVIGVPEYRHSLPSGHASFAMLLAASLWPLLQEKGRWLAGAFVVWVCLSRISLGFHFPADVVAGSLSCLVVVWTVRKALTFVVARLSLSPLREGER
ncbi:MAG: phosphatase PAP2 family protein [Sulfuricellaceae bacterium]|jgi:membrane-associated phospholipid phosphatase